MKRLMTLTALILAALSSQITPSQAHESKDRSILFNCNLSFSAGGKSVYLGIGYTDIDGDGTILCYDLLTGAKQEIPILVKVRGPGAGLGVTGLNVSGGAAGIGISTGPEALLGRYAVARVNAAVGVGAGASAGFRLSKGAVTLNMSVEGQSGLGAGVDLLFVELSRDSKRPVVHTEKHSDKIPGKHAHNAEPMPQGPAPIGHHRPLPPPMSVQVQAPVVQPEILFVEENQPVKIVDSYGRTLKVLMLRSRR